MQNVSTNIVETNQLFVRDGGVTPGHVLAAADATGAVEWADPSPLVSLDVNSLGAAEPITTTTGTLALPGPLNFKSLRAGLNITFDTGTAGEIEVSATGGGGGFPLTVEDEGVTVVADTSVMNFTGSGVTATASGPNGVDVTINAETLAQTLALGNTTGGGRY